MACRIGLLGVRDCDVSMLQVQNQTRGTLIQHGTTASEPWINDAFDFKLIF